MRRLWFVAALLWSATAWGQGLSVQLGPGAAPGCLLTGCTYTGPVVFHNKVTLTTAAGQFEQFSNSTFTTVANASCSAGQQYFCSQSFFGGTITGTTQLNSFIINDVVSSTGNTDGLLILHNVAPNGNSASGTRVGLDINMTDVGSLQGGTITRSGISSATRSTFFMQSNLGGTSSLPSGSANAFNSSCVVYVSATNVQYCSGNEIDIGGNSGATFERLTGLLLVETGVQAGAAGPDDGIVVAASGASSPGFWNELQFGSQHAFWPSVALGSALIRVSPPRVGQTPAAAAALDSSQATASAYAVKTPFQATVPLKATAITGVARLTSDGLTADSFVYDAGITNSGTGYTSLPSVAVTGCTGATIRPAIPPSTTIISDLYVANSGTSCAAEATVAITSGGGSSAAGKLYIAGNTLNFPISSTLDVACTVTATTLPHAGTDAVAWRIIFGATMGATASTTAIVGSPTWTVDYQTSGAAAKFSGSAPAAPVADTTFGAINLSITPTSGTWDVYGSCTETGRPT